MRLIFLWLYAPNNGAAKNNQIHFYNLKIQKTMKNLISFFSLIAFLIFGNAPLTAAEAPTSEMPPPTANVFVHISAMQNTPNGLTAQIDGFTLAKRGKAGKNTLRARLQIKGNRLQIQLHPKAPKVAQLTMPNGLKVSKIISEDLGASRPVVMSGGTTMVQGGPKSSLLQFEIQM